MYMRWNRFLPEWLNVVPLELPGRGPRLDQAPVEDFTAQVQGLLSDYQQFFQQPFAFFGHSMGALLAYGMTRAMVAKRLPLPCALLLSACSAPHKFDPARFPDTGDREAMIADLRRQGGTPEALFASPDLLEMTLDILGADYRLLQGFSAQKATPLPIPIQVLAGKEDDISPSALTAWQDCTTREMALCEFDGGHFFIQEQQSRVLAHIGRVLSADFAKTDAAV